MDSRHPRRREKTNARQQDRQFRLGCLSGRRGIRHSRRRTRTDDEPLRPKLSWGRRGRHSEFRSSIPARTDGGGARRTAKNMVGHNRMAARHSSTHPSTWATTRRRGRIKPASACSRRGLGCADINARGCRSPESRGYMRGAQTAFPTLWIPAFAGMTGESAGMTGVEGGNDGREVRGNDGRRA